MGEDVIQEIVRRIVEAAQPEKIILFDSRARATPRVIVREGPSALKGRPRCWVSSQTSLSF